jgi:penicillin-binding protein 1C
MRRAFAAVSALAMIFAVALTAVPLPAIDRPEATVVLDRDGGWLAAFVARDGRWRLRAREPLPERLRDGVIAFEDRRFRLHFGVDPIALARAFAQNATEGRVVSGGSTITMQVARMISQPGSPRTLAAKTTEAFRALQLELRYSKDEILAMYFDLAPYGGNIEGAVAASRLYFGKDPGSLSLEEIATLIALPNAPERLRPDRHPERLLARRNEVLERMAGAGVISTPELERARVLPMLARRRAPPMEAPHVAVRARREGFVETTIDPRLQRIAASLLAHRIEALRGRGIGHGAVVVIENRDRAVRALVGSPDFAGPGGQVDATGALRSPGSTLKPFVYALAFDRGLAGPRTLLEDVPIMERDGWSPQNFDGRFRGMVSVEEALLGSLNVPAVELARRLEPDGLSSLLERAGFSTFDGRPHGLAVVLGGAEVTLLELTSLYATLASGGIHRSHVLAGRQDLRAVRLFSEEAAFLVTEILRERSEHGIALKTGTSYGRRDAWSIGYDPRYTIGVWIGNAGGRGAPELIGGAVAAPLVEALADVLPKGPWLPRPPRVADVAVCALSGLSPNDHCPHTVPALAIEGSVPRTCSLHVRVDVDPITGHALCERCRRDRSTARVLVAWPPRVASHLAAEDRGNALPPHNPGCSASFAGEPPRIESPRDGDVFRLRRGIPASAQRLPLVAAIDGGEPFWFVDGRLLGRGLRASMDPDPGPHVIVAVDGEGRSASVRVRIDP